jgi:hypothetical protein
LLLLNVIMHALLASLRRWWDFVCLVVFASSPAHEFLYWEEADPSVSKADCSADVVDSDLLVDASLPI